MKKVNEGNETRKPKAYYSHLYDQAGMLTKVNGHILFMVPETGAITEIEPEHVPFLAVLGQVDIAMAQWVEDMAAGGYAKIACTRQQGRA